MNPWSGTNAAVAEQPIPLSDPERALALAYAPRERRAALRALFALDEQFAHLVAAAREPQLALIRLAWWREALEALDRAPPPAQPLLQAIARDVLPLGVTGATLSEPEAGWSALVGEEEGDPVAIGRHARLRGGALFAAAAAINGHEHEDLGSAGALWASVERARASRGEPERAAWLAHARALVSALPHRRWPRALRPLGVLTRLAAADARAGRLSPVGSPGRVLRAVLAGTTGA